MTEPISFWPSVVLGFFTIVVLVGFMVAAALYNMPMPHTGGWGLGCGLAAAICIALMMLLRRQLP